MTAYREDYHAWLLETAELLRSGRFDELDAAQVAEELEDIGASKERELENRLGILLALSTGTAWCQLGCNDQGATPAGGATAAEKPQSQSQSGRNPWRCLQRCTSDRTPGNGASRGRLSG